MKVFKILSQPNWLGFHNTIKCSSNIVAIPK
ncbi:hypothetical protein F889_03440 [Acinetobacter colistiniresistens]|uniref:Uncharacterized protein n=1 Tax=Acinetobacter colistiniresistens TaxID=280145 RepID=N9PG73_9GAMM|nr:hypothetical protein F889_03440 [Acinetobacter colistiniresistens]